MSDISSHIPAAHSYDPAAIEARLNALTGAGCAESEDTNSESPDLEQQFLADDSLTWLGSRSRHGDQQAIIEYHRIPVTPDQTRVVLHLSFRPDLPTAPSVEANLIYAEGRTRITNCTTFGARIEITLLRPNPDSSTVCLEAICTTEPTTTSE